MEIKKIDDVPHSYETKSMQSHLVNEEAFETFHHSKTLFTNRIEYLETRWAQATGQIEELSVSVACCCTRSEFFEGGNSGII